MAPTEVTSWFAVRCVLTVGWPPEAADNTYEERITLWRASSFDEAIERAEAEAREYASSIKESPSQLLDLVQAYRLSDEPGDGAEVFSLLRRSELPPAEYVDAFRHRRGAPAARVAAVADCAFPAGDRQRDADRVGIPLRRAVSAERRCRVTRAWPQRLATLRT